MRTMRKSNALIFGITLAASNFFSLDATELGLARCTFLCQSLVTSSHRLDHCSVHDIAPRPAVMDICTRSSQIDLFLFFKTPPNALPVVLFYVYHPLLETSHYFHSGSQHLE